MRRRWTPQEITTIVVRFRLEGPKQLARELGRTVDAISSQARRYGQKTPRRTYVRVYSSIAYEDLLGP